MDVNGRLNEILKANVNNNECDKNNGSFASSYSTLISYHTKTPQFYDEIKLLLPLNLNEKYHLLFKFFHISCTNASSTSLTSVNFESETSSQLSNSNSNNNNNNNTENNVETLVGYAWLPLYKKGRILVHNQKLNLPIAQTLPNQYLSIDSANSNGAESISQIKWLDNMKPLFKLNCILNSCVHTYVKKLFLFLVT